MDVRRDFALMQYTSLHGNITKLSVAATLQRRVCSTVVTVVVWNAVAYGANQRFVDAALDNHLRDGREENVSRPGSTSE